MAREHAKIKMNAEELAKFASSEIRCIIGTLDDDGGPWGDADRIPSTAAPRGRSSRWARMTW